jgi:hypothetical protein
MAAEPVPVLHGEHQRFLGSVPGKEVWSGTHPDDAVMMRWWFIDDKSARWSTVAGEGSYSTERLSGWVRHGKSSEIRARGSAHRRR